MKNGKLAKLQTFKKLLLTRTSKAERRFKSLLHELKIPFKHQKIFISGELHYIVDFYLLKPLRIIIEIQDKSHNLIQTQKHDYERATLFYKSLGLTVLNINDYDVIEKYDDLKTEVDNLVNLTLRKIYPIYTREKLTEKYNIKIEQMKKWQEKKSVDTRHAIEYPAFSIIKKQEV